MCIIFVVQGISIDIGMFRIVIFTYASNQFLTLGGCCGSDAKKTVIGGWVWAWAFVTDVQA